MVYNHNIIHLDKIAGSQVQTMLPTVLEKFFFGSFHSFKWTFLVFGTLFRGLLGPYPKHFMWMPMIRRRGFMNKQILCLVGMCFESRTLVMYSNLGVIQFISSLLLYNLFTTRENFQKNILQYFVGEFHRDLCIAYTPK